MPDRNAVAHVNGVPIPQTEFARAINAMQAGLDRPLTEADKSKALNLLIDEELIVQEAIGLGLAGSDRLVRKNLVQAMIRSATSLDTSTEISDDQLESFFAENVNLFASPDHYTVKAAWSGPGDAFDHKAVFVKAMDANESFTDAAKLAQLQIIDLPLQIPIGKVSDLLGGEAAKLVSEMKNGDIAGPVSSTGRELYIWLVQRSDGAVAFDDVKETVRAEWKRRQEEAALSKYVTGLRNKARIKSSNNLK